jgi:hypothetical protein
MNHSLADLLRSSQSVFNFEDIAIIWRSRDSKANINSLYYYVKKKELYRIRKGIYAKDQHYDRLELACKIYTPSYISFETVLQQAGIIFQYYNSIFIASYLSKEFTCDNQPYKSRTLKESVLTNSKGLINTGNYYMASAERAFLDLLYVEPTYYFDNLNSLNWKKVFELSPLYENRALEARLQVYYKNFKSELA